MIMTRNTVGALILLLFSHLLFGEAWKLPNLQRRALAAALSIPLLSTSIMPTISRATPLGDHTICAYPACTSQKDILLNSAPSLASKADKADLYNNLASIEKFLSAYPQLLETNDYYSIRGGLRTAPVAQMRITCRKLKVFLPEDTKKQFVQVYDKMIDNFDAMDVSCGRLITGTGSSPQELKSSMEKTIALFSDLVAVASVLVQDP